MCGVLGGCLQVLPLLRPSSGALHASGAVPRVEAQEGVELLVLWLLSSVNLLLSLSAYLTRGLPWACPPYYRDSLHSISPPVRHGHFLPLKAPVR